jgi:starvation-inducible DNA-binding protein
MEKDLLELNLDLKPQDRETLCLVLQKLLASTYALYLKTQNFHWNVTGPAFYSYHQMFQLQYEELAEAIDEIAERIRSLGHFPNGGLSLFAEESLIKDVKGVLPPMTMIEALTQDHETLICYLRENLSFPEEIGDGATADFINKRLAVHEKTGWMLRSTITDR